MMPKIIHKTTKWPEQQAKLSSLRMSLADMGSVDLLGSLMGKWLGAPFSASTIF